MTATYIPAYDYSKYRTQLRVSAYNRATSKLKKMYPHLWKRLLSEVREQYSESDANFVQAEAFKRLKARYSNQFRKLYDEELTKLNVV